MIKFQRVNDSHPISAKNLQQFKQNGDKIVITIIITILCLGGTAHV